MEAVDTVRLAASRYNLAVNLGGCELTYNLSSGACISTPLRSLEHIEGFGDDTLQTLVEGGFLVDAGVDEADLIVAFWEAGRYDSSSCNLTIAPTLACNFRCDYCYAPHSDKYMRPAIADQVVKFVRHMAGSAKHLHIAWLGGEPLLALDTVLRLEEEVRNSVTTTIDSQIVTNGSLLTYQTAVRLASAGISTAIISIDGPRDIQVARRVWRATDSYDLVLDNVAASIGTLEVVVRINVDRRNVAHVPTLLSDLENRQVLDRIHLTVMPIQAFNERCWSVTNRHCIVGGTKLAELLTTCQSLGLHWGGPRPYLAVCNAVRAFDFGIGPDGELYKCPVDVGEDTAVVGHVAGGPLRPGLLRWARYRPQLKGECARCRCLPLCISVCPRYLMNSSTPGLLMCEPMKEFHEALVQFHLGGLCT